MKEKDVVPFGLRMPAQLRDWVMDRAKTNHRSMNGELLALIECAQRADKENAPSAGTGEALVTQ